MNTDFFFLSLLQIMKRNEAVALLASNVPQWEGQPSIVATTCQSAVPSLASSHLHLLVIPDKDGVIQCPIYRLLPRNTNNRHGNQAWNHRYVATLLVGPSRTWSHRRSGLFMLLRVNIPWPTLPVIIYFPWPSLVVATSWWMDPGRTTDQPLCDLIMPQSVFYVASAS